MSAIANVTANGVGDFSNDPDQGQLSVAFRAGSTSGTVTLVVADKVLYATSPVFSGSLPVGNGWVSFRLGKVAKPAAQAFGPLATEAPADVFRTLRRSVGLTTVGPDAVAGQPATHYRVTAHEAGYGPVDVWVGDSGLVLQVSAGYTSSSGRTAVTLSFSGYGEATSAAAPQGQSFDLTDDAVTTLKNGGQVRQ